MRRIFPLLGVMTILLLLVSPAVAGDFDWVGDFNVRARANPADFRARLASRFQAGDEQIGAVIDDVTKPSEAYIVFRLGKMSGQPPDRVMAEYEFCREKSWDAVAKRQGIRPGSREYRKLKAGQGLYGTNEPAQRKDGGDGKQAQ